MNRKIAGPFLAIAMAANSFPILGQNPVREGRQEKKVVTLENKIVVGADGSEPSDNVVFLRSTGPESEVGSFSVGQGQSATFISNEIQFDNKIVKGKPYSADIVKENIQTLADGNRIIRKTSASVARDSEGRTRQEQLQIAFGPLAESMANLPKLFTINDPVSGTTYTLNANDKTAVKMQVTRLSSRREAGSREAAGGAAGAVVIRESPAGSNLQDIVVRKIQPSYPAVAKASGASGNVQVAVVVGETGEVISAEAVSGNPLLREAAVDAGRQWKFKETIVDGKPVKVKGTLTFNFMLAGAGRSENAAQIERTTEFAAGQRIRVGGMSESSARQASKYASRTEELGSQIIEGVSCDGTRKITTIPAGEIGNELAIDIVSESWYSKDLETIVRKSFRDPRYGEDIYRLTNIVRSEPAKELFEVPADYTVKEGAAGWFTHTIGGPDAERIHVEMRNLGEKLKKDN